MVLGALSHFAPQTFLQLRHQVSKNTCRMHHAHIIIINKMIAAITMLDSIGIDVLNS
jgi:hypothetical protein